MSLIQQALEKTSRANETRTTNPAPAPKTYARDPMGAVLERELRQVQQKYAHRRSLYWKVALGVVFVGLAGVLALVGIHSKNAAPLRTEAKAMPQTPVKIFSGYLYRLTGITNIRGKAIAVINNRLVGIGDTLNGRAIVTAIGNGEVRLDIQGKELKLTL